MREGTCLWLQPRVFFKTYTERRDNSDPWFLSPLLPRHCAPPSSCPSSTCAMLSLPLLCAPSFPWFHPFTLTFSLDSSSSIVVAIEAHVLPPHFVLAVSFLLDMLLYSRAGQLYTRLLAHGRKIEHASSWPYWVPRHLIPRRLIHDRLSINNDLL
ncbi:hypothetical protein EDD18DRAFT_430962 [Armillaria luteobubalina]|uniref:Uncharacterized protein n=1 Tax=Armillaria luteobubalina TaxID=153913 RepID=A0AA39UU98_9AGAR|nr:hypothetical protein EDD18DRAFT_430962 [Armillaria luteobubalina]